MPSDRELADFLSSGFQSVWTLEALLLTARDATHCWSVEEMIAALRASDLIVRKAFNELEAMGLVIPENEGCVRFCPVSPHLAVLVTAAAAFYARSPSTVRRLIVASRAHNLTAFAEAFRIRREDP